MPSIWLLIHAGSEDVEVIGAYDSWDAVNTAHKEILARSPSEARFLQIDEFILNEPLQRSYWWEPTHEYGN